MSSGARWRAHRPPLAPTMGRRLVTLLWIRWLWTAILVRTVCFHIIHNVETMHDLSLTTFSMRALRIIWKHIRTILPGMRADGSVEPSLRGTGQGGIGLRSGPHVVCCLLPHPSSSHWGTTLSEHGYCTGAESAFDSFRTQRSNNYHTRLERVFGGGAPKPGGNRERDRDRDRERRS